MVVVSFHADRRAHPWMETALEPLDPFGGCLQLELVARGGQIPIGRTWGRRRALGSRERAHTEWRYTPAAELCDRRERVRSSAFVLDVNVVAHLDHDVGRLIPPGGVADEEELGRIRRARRRGVVIKRRPQDRLNSARFTSPFLSAHPPGQAGSLGSQSSFIAIRFPSFSAATSIGPAAHRTDSARTSITGIRTFRIARLQLLPD